MENFMFENSISQEVKLTFLEPLLGSSPSSPDIYRDYIASKAPDALTVEQEVENLGVDSVTEKGITIFPKAKDGMPFIYDYQIKGMFKDAIGMLRAVKGSKSSQVKAYKKKVDGGIFVFPREIVLSNPVEEKPLSRPLRAQTPQGDRVAIASSEVVPAGTTCQFTILCLDDSLYPVVQECLNYGALRGLGQWRNSGMGKFTWEDLTPEEDRPQKKTRKKKEDEPDDEG